MENFVLIDSNAIIHRAYHALPKSMSTRDGQMTNAVYGFATTLIKVLEDIKPKYIAASFDLAAPTFRHEAYKEYKATRVKADQELYDQIPLVREMLEALNIKVFEKEGFEADDCLGTLVNQISNIKYQKEGIITYIISGDKDIFQLVDGNIKVYNLKHGLSESVIIDREYIKKVFNLDPEDFIDLKALAGDPSDNIPGVPGIGPKTATELLQKFDTLKNLYDQIDKLLNNAIIEKTDVIPSEAEESLEEKKISPRTSLGRDDKITEETAKKLNIKPRMLNLLIEYRDQAFLSQKLATIDRNVPIDFSLSDVEWGNYDKEKVQEFFRKVGFRSILKRFLPEEYGQEELKTKQAKEQQEKDQQLKLL